MNKAELVSAIADASELTKKDAQAALTSLQKVITKIIHLKCLTELINLILLS